jgi:hypothetical protein
MPEDVIESNDADYIMSRIRTKFLTGSTVTLVMVGACTWSRKFIDWEIQSSLRRSQDGLPNGLLAVLLDPNATKGRLPDRVRLNVNSGYAGFYPYPSRAGQLQDWIEKAFIARSTIADKIVNPRNRRERDSACP